VPRDIISLISFLVADFPDARNALSLHNIVRFGAVYGVAPGSWFGPNLVGQSVR
jgi:hypothetical protein